jgi:DNA polymerase I
MTVKPSTAQVLQDVFVTDQSGQGKLDLGLDLPGSSPVQESLIVQDAKTLDKLIAKLKKATYFSVDLETSSLKVLEAKIIGIAIAWQDQESMKLEDNRFKVSKEKFLATASYIPVGHDEGEQLNIDDVLAKLKPLLEDESKPKILHNAKYDFHVFCNYGIELKNIAMDTMLASYVQDSTRRHGLKDLAMSVFGIIMDDYTDLVGKGKNQLALNTVSIEKVQKYATLDAAVTLKLAQHFAGSLDQDEQNVLYEIEMPLIKVLADMERAGVGIDKEYLKKLSKELDKMIAEAEEKVYKAANYPERFNINSTKQLCHVLFDHLGLPVGQKTKTKTGYSTSASVMEKLAKNHEIARYILDYRHLTKLKSTYVDALPKMCYKETTRIHTTFNQTGTTTGRLSSSDPNLQNIPIRTEIGNSIRKAFVPANRKEDVLLAADYSQIELRFLADISQEPNLVKAFKENKDVHTDTATKIFGIPPSQVDKNFRRIAKAVNFGIIYGQTPYGLSEAVGITPKEAKTFIEKYFETYPLVKKYMDDCISYAHKHGYTATKFGRKRYFENELHSRMKQIREFAERAAINSPLQGSASDLIKLAMVDLHHKLRIKNLKSIIILQVHDELVLEVPEKELDIIRELVKDSMENVYKISVPLVVDINIGTNWMEAK